MFIDETEDFEKNNTDGFPNENEGEGAESAPKTAPLPPFDITQGESFLLYDNMKYVCDTDICNRSMIKIESGNVCKGYRVKETKPIKIGGDSGFQLPGEKSTFEDSELENPEYDDTESEDDGSGEDFEDADMDDPGIE